MKPFLVCYQKKLHLPSPYNPWVPGQMLIESYPLTPNRIIAMHGCVLLKERDEDLPDKQKAIDVVITNIIPLEYD